MNMQFGACLMNQYPVECANSLETLIVNLLILKHTFAM